MPARDVRFDVLALAKAVGFDESAREIQRLEREAAKAQKSLHLLSTGLVTGVAAGIPVLGVAAGAMAGLGASAGVAVAGVLGIKDAMKQGTPLGNQYKKSFTPIVDEFERIKAISAQNMFSGINAGLKGLQPLFPTVNRDTAIMARQIGDIAGHAGPGLASLFLRLNPLFITFGDQLVHGAAGFEHWATSSATVGRFVSYVQTSLPAVEQTIGSLIKTASHLVMGLEPFGSTTLTTIRLFSQAINTIPIGVLQALVPVLAGLKVGNTLGAGFSLAGANISKFAVNLQKSEGVGSEFAGVAGKVGKAVGFLGPVGIAAGVGLGVLSTVMGKSKAQAIENTRYVNELTQAIQNNTVAQTTLTLLQQSGAVAAARQLGITQGQLIQAVTGGLDKYKRVSDQLVAMQSDYQQLDAIRQRFISGGGQEANLTKEQSDRYHELQKDIPKVATEVTRLQAAYNQAKQAAAAQAKQVGDNTLAVQVNAGTVGMAAKQWGLSADAYYNAKIAADKNTQSVKQQTIAMQLENNAVGLLNQSLQSLGGNNLGVAQATTAVAQANKEAAKSFHTNGTAIKGNTDKALANQQALEAAASAAIQHGQAVAQQTGSTRQATAAINADKTALEDNLRSQNRLTPAVQAYIDKIFKIPKTARTQVDVNKSQAQKDLQAFQSAVRNLKGKDVPVNLVTRNNELKAIILAQEVGAGRRGRLAAGGGVNEGWFTVGEGNRNTWELGYKRGAEVQIFSNRQSKAMTGMDNPPGYAAGSGINLKLASDRLIAGLLNGLALAMPAGATSGAAQQFALSLFPMLGWGSAQWPPLKSLWTRESGWRWNAINPSSGALGIPQALPGSKMAVAGPDYRTNPQTQIRWGLIDYIKPRYGTPAAAWAHEKAFNWYRRGTPGARRLRGYASGSTADIARTLPKLRVAVQSLSTAMLSSVLAALSTQLGKARQAGALSSPFVHRIDTENMQLLGLAKRRDRVADRLRAANQRLVDAQQKWSEEFTTVRQAVVGSFDITTAGRDVHDRTSAAGILSDLRQKVRDAQLFAADLRRLRGRLNKRFWQQLAEAGPDASLATLQALRRATPLQLAQINAQQAKLGRTATAAAKMTANALYGAGVQAAKALVKGLQSQERAIERQMQRMAASMVRALKHALGIRSPAARLVPLGKYTAQGFIRGLDLSNRHVVAAAGRMAAAAVPNTPTWTTGGRGSGPVIVNVYGSVIAERDLANTVAAALERRQKPLYVKAIG